MKKVIGLCLVVLLSSTSVFARENRRMDKRKMDPSARCEKMIADLKLDEKQAVEFRKLQKEYMEKAQKEREAMKAEREKQREKMLAMREDKNANPLKGYCWAFAQKLNSKKANSKTLIFFIMTFII